MAEPSHDFGVMAETGRAPVQKAPDAFRTISEVSADLDIPQHVLRFWEGKFTQIKPLKRGGGRRYYRPDDVELLRGIQHLLYGDGYTIKGVQKLLREHGVKFVAAAARRRAEAVTPARTSPRPHLVPRSEPEHEPEPGSIVGNGVPEAPAAVDSPLEDEPVVAVPPGDRLLAAAQLLSRLKAMRREYDLKLQAAKNGRL